MKHALLALLVLLIPQAPAHAQLAPGSQELFGLWGRVNKPFKGETESIGTYTAGCLSGAKMLPHDGPGYAVMRLSRLRYFGHDSLVSYIQGLGARMKKEGLPLLLVGDLGRPRGGPMATGHSSHQIGLDVDLWFEMSRKKPTRKERESWGADPFADLTKNELSQAWRDPQRKLMALAAKDSAVERIFVHPTIKRDLCEKFPDADWLYKVRGWWNHHDHLHVRLRCPEGAKSCVPQEAVNAADSGCGEELAWWFTEEAREEGRKNAAKFAGREFPSLPESCNTMVEDVMKKPQPRRWSAGK